MLLGILLGAALILALLSALAVGGPTEHPPEHRTYDPFPYMDLTELPPLQRFTARDGQELAYRTYDSAEPGRGSVVLVHGTASTSDCFHPLSKAIAEAGFQAFALDLRGHGGSGASGRIRFIGQLEGDLEDFLGEVKPPGPTTLLGFSGGGGFTLRVAAGPIQDRFDRYVLLAPFIHEKAPTMRPGNGGWASVGLGRIRALSLLNAVGIRTFNHLPVWIFAVSDRARAQLTHTYTYNLAANLCPPRDYLAAIRGIHRPLQVLVGAADKVFRAEAFAQVFREAGSQAQITLIPGAGHADLITKPGAIQAIVDALLEKN